jgi:release factor glutamine methyltransferase
MTHSIYSLFKDTVLKLKALYPDEEARAMADRLFENYLDITPTQRVISGSLHVNADKQHLINEAAAKLVNHVPLQYITGKAFFMDMAFYVNPSVLIPRPETEELVSLVLNAYPDKKSDQKLRILDIGTGSGCIAISLKRFLHGSIVTAVDNSQDALMVAAVNAEKIGVEISFIYADILNQTHWNRLPQCDLIVSNPPYITCAEKQLMQPNVLDYEPHSALFVPDRNPLIFYSHILELANSKLYEHGSIWFEINEMFGDELKTMAISQGFKNANIIFDIRGKSRFLQCSKKES